MSRIQELEELIRYHKALYYQGRPEINDLEYDEIEKELKKKDPENKALEIVGTSVKGKKIKHETKMLSLNKTYKIEELIKWAAGNKVVSTLKIDGVSCSIVYEDGKLEVAKTRGDGSFGENITEKVYWMEMVPLKIPHHKKRIEIRGELYCDELHFINLSDEMVEIGLDRPTSQRNIVAGLISRKDNIELCRHIQFKAFDLIGLEEDLKTEKEKEKKLKEIGFTPEEFILHKTTDYKKIIKMAENFMVNGDYQIDGLVFTLNELKLHAELGATAHHPRFKLAFKFQGLTKETHIEEIKWSLSRNGFLTPVADVTPVELSGAKISRVTLHNYGMVRQFNLKKGDKIEIVRSGEVIPKFLSVVKEAKGEFETIEKCPSCSGKLTVIDIRLVCENEKCIGQVKEKILNFIQKIGIEDLSSKRLDESMNKGIILSIEDLYKVDEKDFLKLDKFKEKLAKKILKNIENSKKVTLTVFLSALGIQGGAFNKCEKVVSSGYNSIEKILNLKLEDLVAIDGFAEKSATDFIKSLELKHKLIKNLSKMGFSFKEEVKVKNILDGQKLAITGTLSEKRSVIEDLIRVSGGSVVKSISKNTDILITNETSSSSSKFKKAQELEIKILSEDEFKKLVKA